MSIKEEYIKWFKIHGYRENKPAIDFIQELEKQNEEFIFELLNLSKNITSIRPLLYGILEKITGKPIEEITGE